VWPHPPRFRRKYFNSRFGDLTPHRIPPATPKGRERSPWHSQRGAPCSRLEAARPVKEPDAVSGTSVGRFQPTPRCSRRGVSFTSPTGGRRPCGHRLPIEVRGPSDVEPSVRLASAGRSRVRSSLRPLRSASASLAASCDTPLQKPCRCQPDLRHELPRQFLRGCRPPKPLARFRYLTHGKPVGVRSRGSHRAILR